MQIHMKGAGKGRPWRHAWLGLVSAILLTTATIVFAAAGAKLTPAWDASDETSDVSIDHSVWQEILDSYLSEHPSGINRFDYAALKASAADSAKLAGYLEHLQTLDPRNYARAEQKPYWINFYNALTVQVVMGGYPVDTIHKIRKGILPLGPGKMYTPGSPGWN